MQRVAVRFSSSLFFGDFVGGGRFSSVHQVLSGTRGKLYFPVSTVLGVCPLLSALTSRGRKFCTIVGFVAVLCRLSLFRRRTHALSDSSFTGVSVRSSDQHIRGIRRCVGARCRRRVHLKRLTSVIKVASISFDHFFGLHANGGLSSCVVSVQLNFTSQLLMSSAVSVTRVYCRYNFGGLSGFGQVFGGGGDYSPGRFHRGCQGGGGLV